MNIFAGKSTAERKKIIAAIALGSIALFSLYFAFGRGMFGGSTTVAVNVQPTPKPTISQAARTDNFTLPPVEQQNIDYAKWPVVYQQSDFYAPDPGRNIFAFYEPPEPTPFASTPLPLPKPPTPTPTPPILLANIMPQAVYAGTGSFRLEVNGEKFTPDMRIIFNQSEIPTNFVSPQKLTSDIPANFIAGEGSASVMIRNPDGRLYSQQLMLNVQAPPKPEFQYVGMIARKRYNNDTAYFQEQGKQLPTGARLNDIVGGRFRLVSISAAETIFEDVNLGFKHRLQLSRTAGTTAGSAAPGRSGFPNDGTYVPYNPSTANPTADPSCPPGIPCNLPRYVPPANQRPRPQPDKKDVDDNDNDNDDDGNN